jgi:hypothetical protein
MNSKVLSRLEALERLRTPDIKPMLNLIFECNNVDNLLDALKYCDRHNEPQGGIYHSVKWTGEPNAAAEELLAGKFDTGHGDRLDIISPPTGKELK